MKEILIKLREDNRYTQTAVAKMAGVSRQAYMKYELGTVEPPLEVIRKLKELYKIPYAFLIDNRIDLIENPADKIYYNISSDFDELEVNSPSTPYGSSNKAAVKQTIHNSSLEEFALMLFSVAADLKNEKKLTAEEKIAEFEAYSKLAEAQMNIVNGDKGVDTDTEFSKLKGKE